MASLAGLKNTRNPAKYQWVSDLYLTMKSIFIRLVFLYLCAFLIPAVPETLLDWQVQLSVEINKRDDGQVTAWKRPKHRRHLACCDRIDQDLKTMHHRSKTARPFVCASTTDLSSHPSRSVSIMIPRAWYPPQQQHLTPQRGGAMTRFWKES